MKNLLTADQQQLVREMVEHHGIEPQQISFSGASLDPIFDYEALNYLRFKLTDIQETSPVIEERNEQFGIVTARCHAVIPDGRAASDLGSAQIGEILHDGTEIKNLLEAQNVAISRALRRAIRAVGINLVKAHREFLRTGKIATAAVDEEFTSLIGKEIHALANEWGHIAGKDKSKYQDFIQNIFGSGKRSSLDLNDVEKSQLAAIYRQLLNQRNLAEINELPQKQAA